MAHLRLDLLRNAYDYLNESLRNFQRVLEDEDDGAIKFAVVHAAQAVELMLKERLRREHALLVYRNVDAATTTVSAREALSRLDRCGVQIDEQDRRGALAATDLRNELIHFEVDVPVEDAGKAYIGLLEFAYAFHQRELGEELHTHIREDLHVAEALCMQEFGRPLVTYQGAEVISTHPFEVLLAQQRPYRQVNGVVLERFRYGDEAESWVQFGPPPPNCHDCGVVVGQLHTASCDVEVCPQCKGQWLSCDCVDALSPES